MILHQFHYNLYTSTELGQVTIVNYDLGPVYGRLVQNKVPAWTEKIVLRVGFGGQLSFLAALNRISSPVIWPNGALTRSKLCYTLLFHVQLICTVKRLARWERVRNATFTVHTGIIFVILTFRIILRSTIICSVNWQLYDLFQ